VRLDDISLRRWVLFARRKVMLWNDATLKSIAFNKHLWRLFCTNIEVSDEAITQSNVEPALSLSFFPFSRHLALPPPSKEGGLIIMNPFATNGRTAITTFILVPNDSTVYEGQLRRAIRWAFRRNAATSRQGAKWVTTISLWCQLFQKLWIKFYCTRS